MSTHEAAKLVLRLLILCSAMTGFSLSGFAERQKDERPNGLIRYRNTKIDEC